MSASSTDRLSQEVVPHESLPRAGSGVRRSGRSSPVKGAKVTSTYLDRRQDTIGITVEELEDFKKSATDEAIQQTIGNFFVAGGFWLAVERFLTVASWRQDALFWVCLAVVGLGAVMSHFGYAQQRRRTARIDRIIQAARPETTL